MVTVGRGCKLSKPPDDHRPMGKSTLAVEKQKLLLEQRKLELAAEDRARDDKRAALRLIVLALTLLAALALVGASLYWGRSLTFSGLGIEAKTGENNHDP